MRREIRILLLVGVLLSGGALAFAGAQPEGYLTVAQVVDDPGAHDGEVHLKGSIVEGSLERDALPVRFLVADGARTLEVRWDPALPLPDHEAGGTIEGKNVVVRGHVMRTDEGRLFLLAHEMTVGCASKYRPAE